MAYLLLFNSVRGDGSLVDDILDSSAIANKYCVTKCCCLNCLRSKGVECYFRSLVASRVSEVTSSASLNMKEPYEYVASEHSESQPGHIRLLDIVEKVKITVVDIMNNLSDYFHNWFCGEGAEKKVCASPGWNSNAETIMETSLVEMPIMVIMVNLVKRA
ncbi:hypothetical protein OROMI_017805 [Orobanche minor]